MTQFKVSFYNPILISEGPYQVLIKDMETSVNKFNNKEQIRVIFEFLDSKQSKKSEKKSTISAYYTMVMHPSSNLVEKFIMPLLGKIPNEEESESGEFELGQFIGKKCEIQIAHRTKENGDIISVVAQVNHMIS